MQEKNMKIGRFGVMKYKKEKRRINTSLVHYGIREENSSHRIHVTARKDKSVYIYKTENAIKTIEREEYNQLIDVEYEQGKLSAQGYTIYWEEIPGIKRIELPEWAYKRLPDGNDNPSEKGKKVAQLIKSLLLRGDIKIDTKPSVKEIVNIEEQINGNDATLKSEDVNIQIKCDFRGGKKGTRNLFIQVAERNWDKYY